MNVWDRGNSAPGIFKSGNCAQSQEETSSKTKAAAGAAITALSAAPAATGMGIRRDPKEPSNKFATVSPATAKIGINQCGSELSDLSESIRPLFQPSSQK